ncbi:MAG TPA: UDP-N-acetylmuramoyl-L-alanyl-D-glutamate--2,6-diaminopimelate ligase [Propionibacteriaceae bacterium]|nr:UDP-N-acetylmuramoyl-L-alanyl-D-glutamate--2,6-diaminopimelate ligase [Propionibacteriaceae bacterium]
MGASQSGGAGDVQVTGVTLDSRLVQPGDLYVALAGRSHHGAQFAGQAVATGAVAVLTDPAGQRLAENLGRPVLVVGDPRWAMAPAAAQVYGHPSAAMTTYGVTGTNGKTTTSYLLDSALRSVGVRTGMVGTIGFGLDGVVLDAPRTTVTTPEAPELQGLLALLVERGATACVLEVSSHALSLGRVDAITFDVAAFTNFGQDHLDFHGDEESYFESKASLFTPQRTRAGVINIDDPRGTVLVDRLRAAVMPVVTVSLTDPAADYRVVGTRLATDGLTEVDLRTPKGSLVFRLALPGDHNVRNAVTALAMLDLQAVDLEPAAAGLARVTVPGRMQRVELGPSAPAVFVDFAHTPQAVAAALGALQGRRRIAVLGAGGDRDPDKRGPIGAAAAAHADVVVVTDDNPRTEDPAAIRSQVLQGAHGASVTGRPTMVLDGGDRRAAIRRGLELAGPADVLVVLGKGHETGQQVGDTVLAFDDVEVLRHEWADLTGSP